MTYILKEKLYVNIYKKCGWNMYIYLFIGVLLVAINILTLCICKIIIMLIQLILLTFYNIICINKYINLLIN